MTVILSGIFEISDLSEIFSMISEIPDNFERNA